MFTLVWPINPRQTNRNDGSDRFGGADGDEEKDAYAPFEYGVRVCWSKSTKPN